MRKVALRQFATIDALVADPDGETDFDMSLQDKSRSDIDKDSSDLMNSIDWILLGRLTYQMVANFCPEATTDEMPVAETAQKKMNA